MVTHLPVDPDIAAEYDTPRWYDGIGLYVLIVVACVALWLAS